jgi:hypothetical protein
MSELIKVYSLEIKDLKSINQDLIEKNKTMANRIKNQKRSILRLKKFINNLRNNTLNINEDISDDWDCIDEDIDTNNTDEQVYL